MEIVSTLVRRRIVGLFVLVVCLPERTLLRNPTTRVHRTLPICCTADCLHVGVFPQGALANRFWEMPRYSSHHVQWLVSESMLEIDASRGSVLRKD